jgi:hypothetical protein
MSPHLSRYEIDHYKSISEINACHRSIVRPCKNSILLLVKFLNENSRIFSVHFNQIEACQSAFN